MDKNEKLQSNNIRAQFKHELSTYPEPFKLNVDLSLPANGITVLFGHSGAGKSSFLRCCAGLEQPDSAAFILNGDDWCQPGKTLQAHQRPLGFAFQDARLFPHLNVANNLQYAIKRSWQDYDDALYRACLDKLDIGKLLDRTTQTLSGGEKQRVSLARAMLMRPKLLLMDEPLSAVDHQHKHLIIPFIRQFREDYDTPIFYVTHSIEELAQIADHLVVLDAGKCVYQGSYREVLSSLEFSQTFSDLAGTVIETQTLEIDPKWNMTRVAFSGGELWLNGETASRSQRIQIFAKDVSLTNNKDEQSSILNKVKAQVESIQDSSDKSSSLVRLKAGDDFVLARITRRSIAQLEVKPGAEFWVQIKSVALLS